MLIKKTFQGSLPENKIVNTYSNSQTDTYSCNYVNNLGTYSTTEIVVGKWVDNKPIYRKVFYFNTLPASLRDEMKQLPNNIDRVTKVYGFFYITNSIVGQLPFPDLYNLYVVYDSPNIYLYLSNPSNETNTGDAYAIVEYTKTTD